MVSVGTQFIERGSLQVPLEAIRHTAFKAFILIILGTWAYSWILSGIWFGKVKGMFARQPAGDAG